MALYRCDWCSRIAPGTDRLRLYGPSATPLLHTSASAARLADPAEVPPALWAGQPADRAKTVNLVAQEQRMCCASALLAHRRLEPLQNGVPVQRSRTLLFPADQAYGNLPHGEPHREHVREPDIHAERVLAEQVRELGIAVEAGRNGAASLSFHRLGIPGLARGTLLDLAEQALVVGFDARGIAGQPAR